MINGTENDFNPFRLLIIAVTAGIFAAAVFIFTGPLFGGLTYIILSGFLWVVTDYFIMSRFPPDIKPASQAALAAFQADHSDLKVDSIALRADEVERYVFSIRFGTGRPKPRTYYAVDKESQFAQEIKELERYWPQDLK
ncbi:hypothetical protein ACFL27_00535 [candidate division CSSED10-310 bacterium]|uniref:Uncharacterized protein n=1 Tax=candidate division CSSED10-310 bacterium TaxID=2855610 RepID=A0ABV6YR30_UNCC1